MEPTEELKEHAEHAREPFDRRVAATMAIIAAGLAIVSVLAHVYATDELLMQQQSSDTWAQYQAKAIRRYDSEIARDVLGALSGPDASKLVQRYSEKIETYNHDAEEIKKDAEAEKKESVLRGRQAARLDIGEIFLEIAIVFASLAILTKRPLLYWTAVVSGLVGGVTACTTMLIHG
jgi:Domain of unknown function (DUF4337)